MEREGGFEELGRGGEQVGRAWEGERGGRRVVIFFSLRSSFEEANYCSTGVLFILVKRGQPTNIKRQRERTREKERRRVKSPEGVRKGFHESRETKGKERTGVVN